MIHIATTEEMNALLSTNGPVAIGISGGKDSCAVSFATYDYLDSIGHSGPRILIHSDLGRTEWKDSLPTCERLARTLDLDLVVVRRKAGDMLARWQQRWRNNVARYINLKCVKMILPWSTPKMRFCTSEMKTAIICSYLASAYVGRTILSVTGIRRDEGPGRKKKPVLKTQKKLWKAGRLKKGIAPTFGYDWHPIIEWKKPDVFAYLAAKNFRVHEAYRIYGSSRVSCAYCMMATLKDLRAAASCEDNHELYRLMVALEIESTFSFQSGQWLGDVAPHLLTPELREQLEEAKIRALRREAVEARIPKHMLYVKGWPIAVPTLAEAELLCEVRQEVAAATRIKVKYATPNEVIARYEELMAIKEKKVA